MSSRPFLRFNIEQLEQLFSEANDVASLRNIEAELRHRSTPKAAILLRKIEAAIKAGVPSAARVKPPTVQGAGNNVSDPSPRISNRQSTEISPRVKNSPETQEIRKTIHVGTRSNRIGGETVSRNDQRSEAILGENQGILSEKPLSDMHNRLLDLVDYLEHLAKLGEKPIFAVKEYQQFAISEADLKGQIGITHDILSEDGHVWLRIERLQRQEPPAVPLELRDWVVVSRDPFQFPKMQELLTRTVTKQEAHELLEGGKVSAEDLQASPKLRDGQAMVDVILRLEMQQGLKTEAVNYVETKWAPWAETEKSRRNAIAVYDRFFSLCQSLQAEGAERPLETVWGIGVARWKLRNREIDHPLLEQLVDIEIEADTGAVVIRPRSASPQLALKPYFSLDVEGTDAVQDFAKNFFDALPDDQEFSPFRRATFEPVLRFATAHLDSSGRYQPDDSEDINDRSLPQASTFLVMSDTWAIYARPRSVNFFIEDLERLRAAVTRSDNLPGAARKFVEVPSAESTYTPTLIDLGSATLGSSADASITTSDAALDRDNEQEFFFPKAFNEDQIAIIQRLQKADGVVVQGPPGTGKTHTIANIICHCLATGQRVLVTSKGEAALAVLREQIPEGIRDLTISLLTSEREGLKQLERTVGLLAGTATQMNPASLERQIVAGQQEILDLKKRLGAVDFELVSFAKRHLKKMPFKSQADGILPIELAQLVVSDKDRHEWLPDVLSLDCKHDLRFDDDDISTLREVRRRLGNDLCYVQSKIPTLANLPDGAQLLALHDDLVNADKLHRLIEGSNCPRLRLTLPQAVERSEALLFSISEVISLLDLTSELPWLKPMVDRWQEQGVETEQDKLFEGLLFSAREIRNKRTEMVAFAISLSESSIGDIDLAKSINRAASGERPFGFIPIGKTKTRELFSGIRIEGRVPVSAEDWYKIKRYLSWRYKLSAMVVRWNAAASEYALPTITDQGESTARWFSVMVDKVDRIKAIIRQHVVLIKRELRELFPHVLDTNTVLNSRENASQAIESIKTNLAALRLESSRASISNFIHNLSNSTGPIVEELREHLLKNVGNPQLTTHQISDRWQELCREVNRLHSLNADLETVRTVADKVRESGAPNWARYLLTQPVNGEDPWTPGHWSESWSWVRYRTYLQDIDGKDRIRRLSALRLKYESEVQKAFAEVVRLRTYLGLKRSINNQVEAALNMFMTALRHIGRGTGIRARRFRQDARTAMEGSYAAVPCWIMPTWRISENLPAALGSFDLVIIDEASQSDISALPALLRGRKVLVVGDDKQVSPTAAFVEEKKLLQLRHNYLKEQPFGALMLPGFSLYELDLLRFQVSESCYESTSGVSSR